LRPINDFDNISKDGLDKSIYFLKNNKIKDNFKVKSLLEAKGTLEYDKMSEKEKSAYKSHLENNMYTTSMLDGAKFEGKIEEKQQIAKNLLIFGLTLSQISEITGLSVEEIEKLK
jgi:predicted transposase/invertase (TIGR01784 family)